MNRSVPENLLHERRAIRILTLPGLIRLVTEIDDNGPISHQKGSLQGAFGDLTPGNCATPSTSPAISAWSTPISRPPTATGSPRAARPSPSCTTPRPAGHAHAISPTPAPTSSPASSTPSS